MSAPAPPTAEVRDASFVTVLRRAAELAPALRRGLAGTLVLAVVGTAGQVVVPIAVQQLVDRQLVADGDIDLGAVAVGSTIALVALVLAAVCTRFAMYRLVRAASEGLSELRVAAFRRVHQLSSLHVQSERRGVLVSRVTSDIEAIVQFLEWGGIGMVVGAAQIVLVLVVMTVYDPVLTGVVAGAGVLYAVLLLLFQRVLRRAYTRVRERVGLSLGAMSEAISGLPTIRAYGAEDRARAKVRDALDQQFRAEFRVGALGAGLFSSAELFAASVTAAVVAVGVTTGTVSAGQLTAFLFLVALFIEPVQMLVEVLNEAQTAAAGVRRVLEVIDTPVEVEDPGADARPLPRGALDVSFHAVRFRYPTGADVLRDLDVHVAAGMRVAVVGETGSGKSTFVKLVTRLLDPTEGTVQVGGVPLRGVAFEELRRRVVFVPQDGFLWDTTIADNVRYGRPDADDAAIARALSELGLDAWLARFPDGIHTVVGERGGRLSAGERQLLALARAWVAAPDLLVLDEATSAVDPALEVALRHAVERLTAGRTSITVAHRLSTAEAADEVLVFDAGRLVERGPHDLLVASGGVYTRLHQDWMSATGQRTAGEGAHGGN